MPEKTPELNDEHITRPEDRVPFFRKLAFGAGNVSVQLGKQAPKTLAMPIYNIGLHVNPAIISVAIACSRLVDSITDPLMGSISDNCRSRFGRRRPFMLIGAILTAIAFYALLAIPEGKSEMFYSVYFFVTIILFYLMLTVFSVPWYALGYEMTPDYSERTRLWAIPQFLFYIAMIGVTWLYAFIKSDVFDSTLEGARVTGIIVATAILIFGVLSTVFTKERVFEHAHEQEKVNILKGVALTFKNRDFVRLTIAFTLLLISALMVGSLNLYVMIYYLYGGEEQPASVLAGWNGTVKQVLSILFVPVIGLLAGRMEKAAVLRWTMAAGFIGSLLRWYFYTPNAPYLALADVAFVAPGWAAFNILANSMISDICDEDELRTGRRREGMYGAVHAWIYKAGVSLAVFISGFILVWIGFDAEKGGDQTGTTITWMRALICIVPGLGFGGAYLLLRNYTLTRHEAYEIRRRLEARREEPEANPDT